ncbi:hypothetical protein [Alicyclobacillus fastidiosus]|uniref:hypothetical protein n=1 Tax=Alicyclobacillus fastidiosus TaxID=392011 RepID=UPI0023E92805|nr:hypothetical protein [Alicyclobacillus fastidiosus]GMA59701.1 hypothetical protein GCM10025859_01410 [Alicyclobacillus fastidiosus]GMA65551.1 hypothetical protein GCM10025859_59910 [Alicyclobacillus fastidiosus]
MQEIRECPMCNYEFLELHRVHIDDTVLGEIDVCEDCREAYFVQCPSCEEWDKPETRHGELCDFCAEQAAKRRKLAV